MDWTAIITTLTGGGIGLSATGLQHRFARRDAVSDFSKNEMKIVLELFTHLSQIARRLLNDPWSAEHPQVEAAATLEKINVHVTLISDPEVRQRISNLTYLLNDPGGAASPGESVATARGRLLEHGRDVLGARIRGDRLPEEPSWLKTYLAAFDRYTDDLVSQYEAVLAEQSAEEERKRAQARSPDTEGQ